MKKLTAVFLTLAVTLSLSTAAFAAEIDQDTAKKTSQAIITTSIEPTYTVTIPGNVNVAFSATSSDFGTISLDEAKLEPGYAVWVSLATDNALVNEADSTKTISYAVNANGTAFTSASHTTAGEKTKLTIEITQEAWNAACAGDYSDTVTFTVSYGKIGE